MQTADGSKLLAGTDTTGTVYAVPGTPTAVTNTLQTTAKALAAGAAATLFGTNSITTHSVRIRNTDTDPADNQSTFCGNIE